MSGNVSAIDELTQEEAQQFNQMKAEDAVKELTSPSAESPPPSQTPPQAEPAERAPLPQAQHEPEPRQAVEPGTESGQVDRRALEEERRQRKEIEQRLRDSERKWAADSARTEERLRMLSEAGQAYMAEQQAKAAPPPPPPPDFSTDPAAYIQHGFRSLAEENAALRRRLDEIAQGTGHMYRQQQEQAAAQELLNWSYSQEQAFAQTKPDYIQAVAHLKEARARMLYAMGHTRPEQMQAGLDTDVRNLAAVARQQGRNFGEMLYEVAQAHGYRPQANGNGQTPPTQQQAAAYNTPQAATAAERLVRGAEMAQTIGSVSAAPRGETAPARIADMDENEFAVVIDKLRKQGPAAMRSLFGT